MSLKAKIAMAVYTPLTKSNFPGLLRQYPMTSSCHSRSPRGRAHVLHSNISEERRIGQLARRRRDQRVCGARAGNLVSHQARGGAACGRQQSGAVNRQDSGLHGAWEVRHSML